MTELATTETPRLSPSGHYRLTVLDAPDPGAPAWQLRIEAASGAVLLAPAERFDKRHRAYFLWDDHDRAWAYSGDVGTAFWEQQGNAWQRRDLAGSGVAPPPALLALVPRLAAVK